MESMNLVSILAVSLPEAVLSLSIGLLAIGEKNKLKFLATDERNKLKLQKFNLLSFALTVMIMILGTFVIRSIAPNITFVLLGHIIWYTIAIKFTYDTDYTSNFKEILLSNWYKAFVRSIFSLGFLVFAEMAFVSQISLFLEKSINELYSENVQRFLFSLPSRVLQLTAVISLWNWNVILINMKKFKEIRKITIATILLLLTIEASLLYFITSNFIHFDFNTKIVLSVIFTGLIGLNFCMFRLITVVTKVIKLDELKNFKKIQKENDKVIKIAYNYLERNDIQKAKDAIKEKIS